MVVVGRVLVVALVEVVVDLGPLSSVGSDLCGRSRKFPLGSRPWVRQWTEEHTGRASRRVCTLRGICSWTELGASLEEVAVLPSSGVSWVVEVGLVSSLVLLGEEDVEVTWLCSSDPGLDRSHSCQSRHKEERRIQ